MGRELRFFDRECGAVLCMRALDRPWERMWGLLGTNANARAVVLVGCASIHTMWMRYPLDVAFVRSDGRVIASRRCVPAFRFVYAPGARFVLERPSRAGYWPEVGTFLDIELGEERE